MDTQVNPDSRPLPDGWFQHYDASRKVWYYVQTNVMPPKISFTHPAGVEDEIKPTSPPPPNPTQNISSPTHTPAPQEGPKFQPNPVVMPAPVQAKLSTAQLLYASANRSATPSSTFIGGAQTLSPLNEQANLVPRVLPVPPTASQTPKLGTSNHVRSSTLLGMEVQQMSPTSMEHQTGPKMAMSPPSQSTLFQKPGHGPTRSVSYPAAAPNSLYSSTLNTTIGVNQNAGPPKVPHLVTKAQNPLQQASINPLISAAQVPTPLLFSSGPPMQFSSTLPPLPSNEAATNLTGNSASQSLPSSTGATPSSMAKPGLNMPNAQNMTGNVSKFSMPSNMTGNTPNFNTSNLAGPNKPQLVSPSFTGMSSASSPPLTAMNTAQLQSLPVSSSGLAYNPNLALLNASLHTKPSHAANSESVRKNAQKTAAALKQAGRAVGNATKKVAVSTANCILLGVDFLSALTVALLDPKTGKPIVDQTTLQAIYQGQPGADYAGAINALLMQQQQQPTNAAQYQTLIQQIQFMQAQALMQQQQQQQQALQPQQTGSGLQVNAQLDLGALQLNAQLSKPLGQQAPNGQQPQIPQPSQLQLLQQQQQAQQQLQQQLQQQFQQNQLQQLHQQQQQLQLQQQQFLSQAEATANQQLESQLQQQMLLMQQQQQAANQAVYEAQLQQMMTAGTEQQALASQDLLSQMLTAGGEQQAVASQDLLAQFMTQATAGLGGLDPSQMLAGLSGGLDLSSLSGGLEASVSASAELALSF